MKKQMTRLLVSLLVCSLSACKTTNLLVATFEGDTVDTVPAKDLPGNPVGDSVAYQPISNPRLRVQASTVKPGQKALAYTQAPLTGNVTTSNQWLTFKGIRSTYDQTIWFYWTAQLSSTSGNLQIDIQGIQLLWVARLRIMPDGRLMLVRNVATEQDNQLIATLSPQTPHQIVITLKPEAKTFNISVFGAQERATVILNNIPVQSIPNPEFDFEFERPLINFRYDGGGDDVAKSYVFDDVFISKRQPSSSGLPAGSTK